MINPCYLHLTYLCSSSTALSYKRLTSYLSYSSLVEATYLLSLGVSFVISLGDLSKQTRIIKFSPLIPAEIAHNSSQVNATSYDSNRLNNAKTINAKWRVNNPAPGCSTSVNGGSSILSISLRLHES